MSGSEKAITLLQSLFECFDNAQSLIMFVFKEEFEGRIKYTIPLKNIKDSWKLIYSKSLVTLSIAPRSHDKMLSDDALGSIKRHVINDKNKSIIKRIAPLLAKTQCSEILNEEIEHLMVTVDLGVRIKESFRGPRKSNGERDYYTPNDIKTSDDVHILFDEAIHFLMGLFMDKPYEVLKLDYPWFAEIISPAENGDINSFSNEQVLAIFASALVLCFNIPHKEVNPIHQEINGRIDNFLRAVIHTAPDSKSSGIIPENNTIEGTLYPASNSSSTVISPELKDHTDVIRVAAQMIHFGDKNHPELGARLEIDITDTIIPSFEEGVYEVFLGISAKAWADYNKTLRAKAIFLAYEFLSGEDITLILSDTNSRL